MGLVQENVMGFLIEPTVDLIDSIEISYVNMNTFIDENIQYVPVFGKWNKRTQ